jgi:hypothetical protein
VLLANLNLHVCYSVAGQIEKSTMPAASLLSQPLSEELVELGEETRVKELVNYYATLIRKFSTSTSGIRKENGETRVRHVHGASSTASSMARAATLNHVSGTSVDDTDCTLQEESADEEVDDVSLCTLRQTLVTALLPDEDFASAPHLAVCCLAHMTAPCRSMLALEMLCVEHVQLCTNISTNAYEQIEKVPTSTSLVSTSSTCSNLSLCSAAELLLTSCRRSVDSCQVSLT